MEDQQIVEGATELEASLARIDGERRFVIQNVGEATASSVRFTVQAERDKNSPVSAHDLDNLFPVQELPPGETVSVGAIITPGTGLHFRGVVTWQDANGNEQERVYYMSA